MLTYLLFALKWARFLTIATASSLLVRQDGGWQDSKKKKYTKWGKVGISFFIASLLLSCLQRGWGRRCSEKGERERKKEKKSNPLMWKKVCFVFNIGVFFFCCCCFSLLRGKKTLCRGFFFGWREGEEMKLASPSFHLDSVDSKQRSSFSPSSM